MKKLKWLEFALCALILLMTSVSCNFSFGTDSEPEPVAGVSLNSKQIFMLPGDTSTLFALVLPANAADKTLAWSSDNTDVASVGEDGSIHAVDPGEATITVSAGGGAYSDDCAIRVLADEGFISIWDMSQTDTNTLTLPLYPHIDHSFDFTVDWGDGTSEAVTSENAAHTYAEEGIYAVVITGTCEGFGFSYANDEANEDNLINILRWGAVKFHNYGNIFAGCDNLATFSAKDVPDLSGLTNLSAMFSKATIFNANLSAWNTSGITDMNGTFSRAAAFNGDISTWDTSNVTDMGSMFFLASSFNGDISSWDAGGVEDMSYMFRLASAFSQDISSWDTGSVTNLESIFSGTDFNQDISGWDTGNAENMSYMFNGNYQFNQDLSGWDVFKVTTMRGMFQYARVYTNGGNPEGLDSWAVSAGCVTTNMFSNCPLIPLPDWYTP